MRVLVVGSNGMLGRDLMSTLVQTEYTVFGLDIPQIDITRQHELSGVVRDLSPALIINCAAYTAVDKAEQETELAFSINRDGSANLATVCHDQGIPLIHISTDYVFDGTGRRPYRESDPASPIGVYGRSKWEGEEGVRDHLREHLIVRTAWLYGVQGNNFVKTILRLSGEKERIRVVADQFGCPTWARDLAEGLVRMATLISDDPASVQWGTYHFCGQGQTTWHGFAEAIIAEGRRREELKVQQVVPVTTAEYPTPAARPSWSVLDCRKLEENFGIVPRPWQTGLSEMMEELYRGDFPRQ